MGHENSDKQRQAKRRQVQEMVDETDPLTGAYFRAGQERKTEKQAEEES